MKLSELFETASAGSVSGGDIAGFRGLLFSNNKEYVAPTTINTIFKQRDSVSGVPIIKYKQKFGLLQKMKEI